MAGYLLERLGRTLTAYIANSRSRAMPARWATPPGEPTHATPSDDKVTRLKAAHAVYRLIEDEENDQVARGWLISANPRLGGHTPAEFIRDNKIPDVYRAAAAFVEDSYA
ncbi:antitoxin Xre/MbcA/ParS toxin-binding domain-containing protein [Rhodococcus olei]|uniref:antitoxin Xre/MbcA/ParS toxin-binding domain-containing protein n=1 Tax=Rhodococcus olei TaxID=2161675 RepID=UPI0031F02752